MERRLGPIGLLWFDDSTNATGSKIAAAASCFFRKFDYPPTLAKCHSSVFGEQTHKAVITVMIKGRRRRKFDVRSIPDPSVLRHHFLLTIDDGGST